MTVEYTADLAGFKSGGVNFKLTLWDPKQNGLRYLKALTFCLAARLRAVDRERLSRIRNRDVGDPITVRYDGEDICMDYLRAVLEVDFIAGVLDLDGACVVEIGAGYGRTCHALMSNYDVAEYHIVERDDMLQLSRAYLRAVLDADQFAKLSFHTVTDIDDTFPRDVDLAINIDSFAVMEEGTVRNYLSLIEERCRVFYVNGPVGKYLDKNLDNHSQGAEMVAKALNGGLLREVLDIYDSEAVAEQSAKFRAVYLPGPRWERVADAPTSTWSHYWQAAYRRVG
jgi:putative sugar O-methyltransferase